MLEHHLALMVMNMLPGVGPGRKRLLAEHFGSCEAALGAPEAALCKLPGIGEHFSRIIHGWREYCNLEEELSLVRRSGAVIVTEEDDDYPPLLREIHDPPICLYVLGDKKALRDSRNAVAIVGSRYGTGYGLRMADRLAADICQAGWPVVSGLARGIDTAAHQAAVRCRGVTVAVIGAGLLNLYPQENTGLARDIVATGGAVITEFPMKHRPDKRSFPLRNRIISGMSRGTIVVQAGLQSGSLITAAQALEQNRAVFAMPGPVDLEYFRGCHALLKDGARLVESFADVLDEFSQFPGLSRQALKAQNEPKETKTSPPELQMSELEMKLWNLLDDGEMLVDDLIDSVEDDPSSVLACLMTMELRHLVRQLPGKRVVRNV